jgi:small-conductance mechanosensitive channel
MTDTLHTWITAVSVQLAWAPAWAISLALVLVFGVAAIVIHTVAVRIVRRRLARHDKFWSSLAVRARRPTRMALVVVALSIAASIAPLTQGQAASAKHVLLVLFILLLGWTALTALDIGAALYLRKFKVDVEDNLLARKHITQIRILRRAVAVLVGLVTVALALMTIPGVRQWGVSLLAAGGAASIILGLALQPLLTNLIAGIQIAITQPIRIDDAVIVEKEWGNVEEIGATYVVVRLWDWRRLVLPLSYFIQNPVPELDAGVLGADRHVDALRRSRHAGSALEDETRRSRPRLTALGRQGDQSRGHRPER